MDSHFELIATVCRYFRKVTGVLGGWVVPVVRSLGAAGGRGGAGEGGLGDSQIHVLYSPKRKYIGMKARGIMKKSKDRGIFSSIISYICP